MDFISVDVETANWDKSSICQIGWVIVKNGLISDCCSTLIDPRTYFDPFNVGIHGITAEMVVGKPTFGDVREHLKTLMNSMPVISYGLFDRAAFDLADDGNPDTSFVTKSGWINGQKIVRRAWPEHFKQSYRLGYVAETLGLELEAHDAGSDARVLAEAIILAADKLEMTFAEFLERASQPFTPRNSQHKSLRMVGGDDGPLSGQSICFTGSLGMIRREAAELVNALGAAVTGGVTKKTTILVIGTQDSPLVIDEKSCKHRRAEELINAGYGIEVLSEMQFLTILNEKSP